jgi:hypothetical protein
VRSPDYSNKYGWRHFENLDPGGGADPGDPNSVDPYTDPGGGPGAGLPPDWQVFPAGSPFASAPDVPTGPPSTGSYYGNGSKPTPSRPPPAPDLWAGISGAVHAAATSIVDDFENLIGGAASGFDLEGTELALAKSGINITYNSKPMDAFQWLFDNKLTDAQRGANQWAQFGMDKDMYGTLVAKFNATFFDWTGDQLSANDSAAKNSGMWQALRENWTPDQIRNFAMYGNAEGTGPLQANAQFTGADPWLSQGQTYSQTLQQFQQLEDTQPTDRATLAAFWRFGASARTVGAGAGATETLASKPINLGTAVR